MSFLDATGLGTFWAKLKNYFVPAANTVAPVTGLTDILTPVNLMPNSDFSFTNGFARSGSDIGKTINHNSTYRFYNNVGLFSIYYDLVLNSYNVSNGKITVNFTVGTKYNSTSDTVTSIMISFGNAGGSSSTYTFSSDVTWIDNNSDKYNTCMYYSATESTIKNIYSLSNDDKAVRILKTTSSNNGTLSIALFMSAGTTATGKTFTVEISNLAVYEGQFLNPPATTGLDVKNFGYMVPFNYHSLPQREFHHLIAVTPLLNKWVRVCKIGIDHSLMEFIITRNENTSHQGFTKITVSSAGGSKDYNVPVKTFDVGHSSATPNGDRYRTAYDADGNAYFEIYTTNSYFNSYHILVIQYYLPYLSEPIRSNFQYIHKAMFDESFSISNRDGSSDTSVIEV